MADLSAELTEAQAQLVTCREALNRAYKAQQYSQGDTSVTRQSIKDLQAAEARLIRRIDAINSAIAGGPSGGARVAAFQWD